MAQPLYLEDLSKFVSMSELDLSNAVMAQDETGRPLLVVRDQGQKTRVHGVEAVKQHIRAAQAVGEIVRTSLGPRGMDKILISPDGDITVTNDGATILARMELESQVAKLLVELARSQDDEIGDGTTGVIVLAGALLEQSHVLIDRGIHPIRVANGLEVACQVAVATLEQEAEYYEEENDALIRAARTSLGSKVVNEHEDLFAQLAVDAVTAVADRSRKDVDFDLIQVVGKTGGSLGSSRLLHGVLVDKEMAHPQMPRKVSNAKIAILTCPLEPPKPKTKHNLDIGSVEEFKALQEYERKTFEDMIVSIKRSGATFVVCQWGFDDEANHLLLQNDMPALRWVGGPEIELLAVATGARIVARIEDLREDKLGLADVEEIEFGQDRMTVFTPTHTEQKVQEEAVVSGNATTTFAPAAHTVSILVRGSNDMIVEEAKRALHDSLCVVRNLVRDKRVVYGGGAAEIAASLAVAAVADELSDITQYAFRAFSKALDSVPLTLAENSGLNPIEVLADLKSKQVRENSSRLGVDCLSKGSQDMKKQFVVDPLIGKRAQFLLATQLARIVLKINSVIEIGKSNQQ